MTVSRETFAPRHGVLGELKRQLEELHSPEEWLPGISRCVECQTFWPCATVKLVRGEVPAS